MTSVGAATFLECPKVLLPWSSAPLLMQIGTCWGALGTMNRDFGTRNSHLASSNPWIQFPNPGGSAWAAWVLYHLRSQELPGLGIRYLPRTRYAQRCSHHQKSEAISPYKCL